MPGKLYVVGTPIGNIGDSSPRAVETLSSVDFIAAEDTRVTIKLLNHFEIKNKLISYHEHNRAEKGGTIIDMILSGKSCALVSDAGMPVISDPGQDLVKLCRENGIEVEAVPGPSAVITALAVSGLNVARFTFEGFLTGNKPKRREHLEEIKSEKKTMVFYEAPHKLADTLHDLHTALGDRRIAIIKELTKIHENAEYTTLAEADGKYDGVKLKGEYVLIIEAKSDEELREEASENALNPIELAKSFLSDGIGMNEAAKRAAKETGAKKGDIYRALINSNDTTESEYDE